MFTGIVEEVGTISGIQRGQNWAQLTIAAQKVLQGTQLGDSIAVNGVCLTVTQLLSQGFCAHAMHETLDRSALAELRPGSRVNLERAMAADGRFGGHIVAGHVDGVGRVDSVVRDATALRYRIQAPPQVMRYLVEKGSVAIDGISLTVAREDKDRFQVSIIPHTAAKTILSEKKNGDMVNLENDCVGKYVAKLLQPYQGNTSGDLHSDGSSDSSSHPVSSGITAEFLLQNGF